VLPAGRLAPYLFCGFYLGKHPKPTRLVDESRTGLSWEGFVRCRSLISRRNLGALRCCENHRRKSPLLDGRQWLFDDGLGVVEATSEGKEG